MRQKKEIDYWGLKFLVTNTKITITPNPRRSGVRHVEIYTVSGSPSQTQQSCGCLVNLSYAFIVFKS